MQLSYISRDRVGWKSRCFTARSPSSYHRRANEERVRKPRIFSIDINISLLYAASKVLGHEKEKGGVFLAYSHLTTAGKTGEMRADVDLDCGQTLMMQAESESRQGCHE